MKEIIFKPIGVVHSQFKDPYGTPIQSEAGKDMKATVEVFPDYMEGLKDVKGFSHIILLTYFHKAKKHSLHVVPYMDSNTRGVFATRAPSRPNSIGLSIVRIKSIENNIIHIKDVDILDGTPLLDIKPYIPEFDEKENVKTGWLDSKIHKLRNSRDDGRFS